MTEIQPVGALRVRGWMALGTGLLFFAVVAPMFWIGGATDQEGNGGIYTAISWVALALGVVGIVLGLVTIARASKRAAANREAAQRAALHGYSSDSSR